MKEEMEIQWTDISVELRCGAGSSFRRIGVRAIFC